MEIKCVIEIEHTGIFDKEAFVENLNDFISNDEQTYFDKSEIRVIVDES